MYPHEFSKFVVLAGMPEPSAMDGNFATYQVLNESGGILKFHIHVTGCRHPCQHDDFPAMLQILITQNIK